ncbi:hypothetical protein KAM622c_09120 [Klebsiella quasipneumoniae subsp. quasipneumoniae]|nr:hypothetical protein KAM622c_09120 [Klebsiella quasipneumoniae subsp. quasipneumoniae]
MAAVDTELIGFRRLKPAAAVAHSTAGAVLGMLAHQLAKRGEVKQFRYFITMNIDDHHCQTGGLRKILCDFINEF